MRLADPLLQILPERIELGRQGRSSLRFRPQSPYPHGHSALMVAAARLRHIASTKWGKRRYMVLDPLSIAADSCAPRFHKTSLEEFYRVVFRKNFLAAADDLDTWVRYYNLERPHQGRWCYGKTPTQTLIDSLPVAKKKQLAA